MIEQIKIDLAPYGVWQVTLPKTAAKRKWLWDELADASYDRRHEPGDYHESNLHAFELALMYVRDVRRYHATPNEGLDKRFHVKCEMVEAPTPEHIREIEAIDKDYAAEIAQEAKEWTAATGVQQLRPQ